MNTLNIQIPIPAGHKIDTIDKETGSVTLIEIPKNPRERLNIWEDILQHHGMTQSTFDNWCAGLRPHEVGTREVEMILAAYNGRQLDDPLPIWGSNTYPKGFGYYEMPSPSGAGFSLRSHVYGWTFSSVGARLVFFGDDWEKNLKDAHKKFLSHFEKSMTL